MGSVHQAEARGAPRYRGVSYTSPINAANEAVPVIDLADRLAGPGKMRRVGNTWVTNCLLPNHEDRSPSFVVYPETNSWYCFSCLHGGDAVELARLVWGYDQRDAHVAAANLLHEFGHEIPKRPPAWFRKQERQKATRDLIEDARVEVMTRRLWRYILKPIVAEIEDPEERVKAGERLWSKVEFRARQLVQAREERKS
jgi:CHC2 zinc finger